MGVFYNECPYMLHTNLTFESTLSLGKYGTFKTNDLLGRPFYLTFDILDNGTLRVVPAAELHADTLSETVPTGLESHEDPSTALDVGVQYDGIGTDGEVVMRSNRLTVDDSSRQKLTAEDIAQLKKADTSSGKDIIAKILESHSALDEKTAFSLAKYTLRKTRKFLQRFTVLPLNVSMLTSYILDEKDAAKVLEIRDETLGLIASWSNIHYSGPEHESQVGSPGRWLVVDDTGGLIVALLAERMGILYPPNSQSENGDENLRNGGISQHAALATPENDDKIDGDDNDMLRAGLPGNVTNGRMVSDASQSSHSAARPSNGIRKPRKYPEEMSASHDTITLLHAAGQPNISLLNYFSYVPNETGVAATTQTMAHPLYKHLKTLSWLQLLDPESDPAYEEPDLIAEEVMQTWKSSKRSTYYRKRRRWERTKRVIDETRSGGFDGLIVTSTMIPTSIIQHAVPLLRGGAQVVVFSPNVEALMELVDCYSSGRRAAFLEQVEKGTEPDSLTPSVDFPVDPRLLLSASLQTARARQWQILPGRTHPLMTSKGGAEGYLFTGTRVLPAEGRVEARGRFGKKRKLNGEPGA